MARKLPTDPNAPAKPKRPVGPKTVFIHVRDASAKEGILGLHTNTRTLVEAVDANPGSTYVKVVLPHSPRGGEGASE